MGDPVASSIPSISEKLPRTDPIISIRLIMGTSNAVSPYGARYISMYKTLSKSSHEPVSTMHQDRNFCFKMRARLSTQVKLINLSTIFNVDAFLTCRFLLLSLEWKSKYLNSE